MPDDNKPASELDDMPIVEYKASIKDRALTPEESDKLIDNVNEDIKNGKTAAKIFSGILKVYKTIKVLL